MDFKETPSDNKMSLVKSINRMNIHQDINPIFPVPNIRLYPNSAHQCSSSMCV